LSRSKEQKRRTKTEKQRTKSVREQQSLRTWIVNFFLGSAVIQLACSSEEWCLFWISRLTHCFCYVAMHCRHFAETKTLWEHLNSSADIFQLLDRAWNVPPFDWVR